MLVCCKYYKNTFEIFLVGYSFCSHYIACYVNDRLMLKNNFNNRIVLGMNLGIENVQMLSFKLSMFYFCVGKCISFNKFVSTK